MNLIALIFLSWPVLCKDIKKKMKNKTTKKVVATPNQRKYNSLNLMFHSPIWKYYNEISLLTSSVPSTSCFMALKKWSQVL